MRLSLVAAAVCLIGPVVIMPAAPSSARHADTIWVLYNHGSSGKDGAKDCWPEFGFPKWAKALDGSKLTVRLDGRDRQMTVRFEWFCSDGQFDDFRLTGDPDKDCPGLPTVCVRAFLIAQRVARLAARPGADRRMVFVAGQSAGGWAAMLVKRWDPNRFNGVIATSPNFFGSRHNRYCVSPQCDGSNLDRRIYPGQYLRIRIENFLAGMPYDDTARRPVLLFAMHCDAHNYPWEFPFARDYSGGLTGFSGAHRAAEIKLYPNTKNMRFAVTVSPHGVSDDRICPRGYALPRYHNGRKRFVCVKYPDVFASGNTQYCSRKRIAFCHDNDGKKKKRSPNCSRTAHSGFYRGKGFGKYAAGIVREYIVERIQQWRPAGPAKVHGYPCSFIKLERRPENRACPARVEIPARARFPLQ